MAWKIDKHLATESRATLKRAVQKAKTEPKLRQRRQKAYEKEVAESSKNHQTFLTQRAEFQAAPRSIKNNKRLEIVNGLLHRLFNQYMQRKLEETTEEKQSEKTPLAH